MSTQRFAVGTDPIHYADEDWREQWHKDFPDDAIPAHEELPYDRDRLLPKAD